MLSMKPRMLLLGIQVLLGFQMRSAFEDKFEKLPGHTQVLDAIALTLMVLVVAFADRTSHPSSPR